MCGGGVIAIYDAQTLDDCVALVSFFGWHSCNVSRVAVFGVLCA